MNLLYLHQLSLNFKYFKNFSQNRMIYKNLQIIYLIFIFIKIYLDLRQIQLLQIFKDFYFIIIYITLEVIFIFINYLFQLF